MTRSLLLLLLAAPLFAADPAIRFPDPPAPAPSPMPAPGTPTKLPGDVWYVVESDTPLLVFDVPTGVVKVTREDGPLKVKGKFVDGAGVQTKTFRGPHVYTIEATHAGKVEVLFLPVGAKDASEAARKTLEVTEPEDCEKPKPPKPPTPEPDAKAPIPGPGLKVLIVYETGKTLPPQQGSILDGKRVRDYLDANCVVGPDGKTREYRIWDQGADTVGESARWQDAMKRTRTGVPWVVISNEKSGFEGPLPSTPDAFLELIKKYEVKP